LWKKGRRWVQEEEEEEEEKFEIIQKDQ